MHLFRFTAAVALVVSVSLVSIALEKRHLELQRAISLQQYRTDQLLDQRAHLALRVSELTSPMRRVSDDTVSPRDPAAGEQPRRSPGNFDAGTSPQ